MTAAASNPFDRSPVPELPPDTSPAAIRDALIDEERDQFERAYRKALAEASEPSTSPAFSMWCAPITASPG
jgi:uncharacterized protein DUF6247